MYIRQISRRRADGSEVAYLQLARKVRDPERSTPRDEVLYHFGRADISAAPTASTATSCAAWCAV